MKHLLSQIVHGNAADRISYRYPSIKLFWCVGFVYASLLALLLQKGVLPLIPALHAGHGLLSNDAIVFHNLAVEVAERIRMNGWSEWRLYPNGWGNVGMLSAIYALFGPEPAWFIPINAAAHVTGAVLIYRMGGRLCPGNAGMLGGLIAGIAFLTFPSALQWYGQNHKDAFAIAGTLLVLDAWLDLHSGQDVAWTGFMLLVGRVVFGAMLVGLVRPYFSVVLVCALIVSFLVATATVLIRWHWLSMQLLVRQLVLIIFISMVAAMFSQVDTATRMYGLDDDIERSLGIEKQWIWKSSAEFPLLVDKVFK